ncbi:hypothetical protein ACIRU3_44220 [Streptomyces sp. NPDC101151]|uniref:hypothetical protein n=1 Tax=Streptomyces sp. NPDC101151 TaxID=3366115 RepID=UPI0037F8E237
MKIVWALLVLTNGQGVFGQVEGSTPSPLPPVQRWWLSRSEDSMPLRAMRGVLFRIPAAGTTVGTDTSAAHPSVVSGRKHTSPPPFSIDP